MILSVCTLTTQYGREKPPFLYHLFRKEKKEMAKRRANNEGSIYKIPNNKWRAQISVNHRRKTKVFSTQKECQEWIKQFRNHIDNGYSYNGSRIRLENFLL